MTGVRKPAAAGRFYPNDPGVLHSTVQDYLGESAATGCVPKAIIVPHAGYVYSGPIAASAYATLKPLKGVISRVILLGPSHFVPVRGLAAPEADTFETPLGPIAIDIEARERALALPQVQLLDAAHSREHSLEVQLPFLQEVLGEFRLLPLAVGDATPKEISEVLELFWDEPGTVIVVSSDLSHFHDYETARSIDEVTSGMIESLRYEELSGQRACGYLAISGLLAVARDHGCHAQKLDLRNSGDTEGDRDNVVGYGAFAIEPADADSDRFQLSLQDQATLLGLARDAIKSGLLHRYHEELELTEFSPRLKQIAATFVTLHLEEALRGCMGSLKADEPLVANVWRNAYAAAFRDPRFAPLTADEFDRLHVHISILSRPTALQFATEAELLAQIRPGTDGLILSEGNQRGTLLPSVWEHVTNPREFLLQLKRKADLPPDYWSPAIRVARYTATSISDDTTWEIVD